MPEDRIRAIFYRYSGRRSLCCSHKYTEKGVILCFLVVLLSSPYTAQIFSLAEKLASYWDEVHLG